MDDDAVWVHKGAMSAAAWPTDAALLCEFVLPLRAYEADLGMTTRGALRRQLEVDVPPQSALEEVGHGELTEFYEKLHHESTTGDAIHAIARLRRLLVPDEAADLARKLDLVLPYALQCFSVSCGGDFVTKLHTVRLNHVLTEAQKDRWLRKNIKKSRHDCEHVLALDEFKVVAHATDHQDMFAELVQREEVATGLIK